MKKRLAFLLLSLLTLNTISDAQRNSISVDSLLRTLTGSWTALAFNCKKMSSDSVAFRLFFHKDHFTMTRIANGQEGTKETGTFTVDSVNTTGYRMRVLMDKAYPEHPYNALLLNLDVFEPGKIRVSLFECVAHKGEWHTRHYPGDFNLFKDEDGTTTR